MTGWIHASRLTAILLMAFLIGSDLAMKLSVQDSDVEAAPEVMHMAGVTSRGGPRPLVSDYSRPDVLIGRLNFPVPPTPTEPPATPEPTPTAVPQPQYEDLGVFKITGYSDSADFNGTDGRGITKSGERTHWGVVAVDPRVIPLGSELVIEGMEDTVFTALDTGGGIKGRWVDVWYRTDWDAFQHGVRQLKVHLVRK